MGSPSAVLTLGFGSWGSTGEVLTLGFGSGEEATANSRGVQVAMPGRWRRTQAGASITFTQVSSTKVHSPTTTTRSDNPYGTKDS